jgi:GNAT superfamily N-acetyltransferase
MTTLEVTSHVLNIKRMSQNRQKQICSFVRLNMHIEFGDAQLSALDWCVCITTHTSDGEDNMHIIGILFLKLERDEYTKREFQMFLVYVRRGYRRMRVGTELLNAANTLLRRSDTVRVNVADVDFDCNAVNFFYHNGYSRIFNSVDRRYLYFSREEQWFSSYQPFLFFFIVTVCCHVQHIFVTSNELI